MRFLKLKKHCKPRPDGTTIYNPLIVDAPRRFAPQKDRKETTLSKKKCQLILGAHDSGKSRWLSRLYKKTPEIWSRSKVEPVFLGALQPVGSWVDHRGCGSWHTQQETAAAAAAAAENADYIVQEWQKMNQQQKAVRLAEYVAATGAVLFIDDAHKLTGRKLEIARQCVISAKIWIIACNQENRLSPSLRGIVERRDPQRTKLATDAAYDATTVIMWLMMAAAMGVGWWEAALVLGGLKMLGNGRRAAKVD